MWTKYYFNSGYWNSRYWDKGSSCLRNSKRIPQAWVNILTSKIKNPDGIWADFNQDHKIWKQLKRLADDSHGIICQADVPREPIPADYTDLEGDRLDD